MARLELSVEVSGLSFCEHFCPLFSSRSIPLLGDSMSKVQEKSSTSKSGFFLNEMWKIIRQFDDFGCFFLITFYNFKVFYPKRKNTQNDSFDEIKIKKKVFFFKDSTTYFKYHIYHSYSINLLIFFSLFCCLQWFRPFFTVLVIFMFFNNVKNMFLEMPTRFQRFNISTEQNFLSNKKSRSTRLRYGLGAMKHILAIFGI